jgi:hypothetical protein
MTSCFAASAALLAPDSSSHVGVNPSPGDSHSRSSLSDLSYSDMPMNPSPLYITGCTVGITGCTVVPMNPSHLDITGCFLLAPHWPRQAGLSRLPESRRRAAPQLEMQWTC